MHKVLKAVFLILMFGLNGCAGPEGPIKTYDEAAVKDRNSIAILYLPAAIELLEVDGVEYNTPFVEKGHNQVYLLPGKHVAAVKYVQYWGDEMSGSMVYSEPVLFKLDIEGSEKIYLNFDRPKDIWTAQAMAKRFQPWLEDSTGKKLDVKGSQFFTGAVTMTSSADGTDRAIASKDPLNELKFWWKKATYEEKEKFKKWLDSDE